MSQSRISSRRPSSADMDPAAKKERQLGHLAESEGGGPSDLPSSDDATIVADDWWRTRWRQGRQNRLLHAEFPHPNGSSMYSFLGGIIARHTSFRVRYGKSNMMTPL
jgi:hypothetical protein